MIETKHFNYHLILLIGLFLCLVVRDIIGISINKYLILVFVLFVFLKSNVEELVAELFFIFPLFHGLPGTYIALAGIIIYLFRQKQHSIISIFFTVFFMFHEIIASIWYPFFDLTSIVKYLSILMLFIFLLLDKININFKKCVVSYFLGVLCFCFVIVISRIVEAPSNWMSLFASGQFRFGELVDTGAEGIHLRSNANELAYYSLAGISVGMFLLDNVERKTKKWIVSAVIFIAFSGYLSLSRTWIILVALIVVIYFIAQLHSVKRTIIVTGALGAIFFIVYRILLINSDLLTGIVTRFNYENTSSLNNRIPILQNYWNAFFSNIRFLTIGTGVTQYRYVVGIAESMHNMLEQIVICYGLIGSPIYLYIMIKSIFSTKYINHSFEAWLPVIGVLLFVQTIQFVSPSVLMLPFVVAVFCLRIEKKKTNIYV